MTVSSGGSRHQLSRRWHEQSESTRAPAGTRSRTRLLGGPRVPKTTRQRSVSRTKLPSAGCQRKGRDLSQFARRTAVARQLRKHTGGQHTRILLAVFFLSPQTGSRAARPQRTSKRGLWIYILFSRGGASVAADSGTERGTPASDVSSLFAFSWDTEWQARQTLAGVFEIVFVSFFSATIVQFISTLFFNLPQAPLLRYEATLPKRQQIGGDKTGVQLVQQKDGVVAARLRQLSVACLRVRGTWGRPEH